MADNRWTVNLGFQTFQIWAMATGYVGIDLLRNPDDLRPQASADLTGDDARRLAVALIEAAFEIDERASRSGPLAPIGVGQLGEHLKSPSDWPEPEPC